MTTPTSADFADYLDALADQLEAVAARLFDPRTQRPEDVDTRIGLASSDLRLLVLDMRRRAALARRGQWERPSFLGPEGGA